MASWAHQSFAHLACIVVMSLVIHLREVEANGIPSIRLLNKTRGVLLASANEDVTICGFQDEAGNSTHAQEVECGSDEKFCFAAAAVDKNNKTHRLSVISQGCWPNKPNPVCDVSVCVIRTPIPTSGGRILPEFCCCKGLYCNLNLTFAERTVYPNNRTIANVFRNKRGKEKSKSSDTIILGAVSSVFALTLVFSIVFITWRCLNQRKELKLHLHSKGVENGDEAFQGPILDLNNIIFADLIHEGHYSTVRRGMYDGCDVVVKSYPPHSHNHWQNERNIYYTVGNHPNVAKFLASFEVQTETGPEGVLVMDFYPNGSLLHFLKQNTVSWEQMCRLALTVANGLAYLHGEVDEYIPDQTKKPVIVHRDLNSRNVLVKQDGSCALADFGFAVHLIGKQGEPYPEVGTVRYMPPEMLGGAVNWHDESALKQADVYSLGLVVWEIARRCKEPYGDQPVPEAKLPYEEELACHPTPDMIHQLVVHDFKRPAFPEAWTSSHFVYQLLKDTIEECWDQEPEARLTALCVVRRMQEIIQLRQLNAIREHEPSVNNRSGFSVQHLPKDFRLKNIVSNNIGKRGCYQPLSSNDARDTRDVLEPDKRSGVNKLLCKRSPCAHDCCCIPNKPSPCARSKSTDLGDAKAVHSEGGTCFKSDHDIFPSNRAILPNAFTDLGCLSSSLPHDLHRYYRQQASTNHEQEVA